MRLLVTGTKGQVACALAERSRLHKDIEVVCVGRPDLELTQSTSIRTTVRAVQPDIIVSAAAYTAVDDAEAEPDTARIINAVAPSILAAAAFESGARLIHLSTDYVYDGRKSSAYLERDPTGPQSIYGATKLDGEAAVVEQIRDYTILRTSWIYSPFGRNFVKTVLRLATEQDRLKIVDDQHGTPTSALDLADAILHILQTWKTDPARGLGQVYHCAGSGETTWCCLARHVLEVSKTNGGPSAEVDGIPTECWPTSARRPRNSRLDCSKFVRDFHRQLPAWRTSVETVVHRLMRT